MTLGFNVGAIISLGDMETALDYLHNEEMFRPEIDDYVAEKSVKAQEEQREGHEISNGDVIDASELFGAPEIQDIGGAKHEGIDESPVTDEEQNECDEGASGKPEEIPGEAENDDDGMWFSADEGEESVEPQGLTSQVEEEPTEKPVEPKEEVIDASELFGGIWATEGKTEGSQERAEQKPARVELKSESTEEKQEGTRFRPVQVQSQPKPVSHARPVQSRPKPAQPVKPQVTPSAPKQALQRPVQQRTVQQPQARLMTQKPQARPQQRPVQQRAMPQKPAQSPNKFQEYDGMTAAALWGEVRQWIDSQGLAKKLISVAELEDNFGKNSIKRLTSQGYLISLGGGTVAIGR